MTFQTLSTYFSQLEQTTKRLELIDILSTLFGEIKDAEEGRQVTYLLQGRVAAFYEPIEFGMADRLIERGIALGTGTELKEVQVLNKKMGDLGKTVEELRVEVKDGGRKMGDGGQILIGKVYSELQKITQEVGDGSIERKVDILAKLVAQMDALSAKYAVRIVSGTLRLGIGDASND